MKFYYVYILECNDGMLYTGFTNDVARRVDEHEKGLNKACYTYKRRPVKLIWHETFNDINQAIFFEKKIKKWSKSKKYALVNGDNKMLQILAECRNASHYDFRPD
ncbi:GIY-YIG nuclease family protein [Maribacter litopenaei]|uniref:GIY-YIG nuclease family protein n=1 Tax=Maribacter litopenaei TaxID=2976127 RepID=A0ABY5Y4I7_9FLAO|nr:GIY-YIG nuclease family protein [Maribacter litopenaei]UWX53903.1 GIY-YIG nuclease family protein [Maribacter litopenaei]